MKNYIKLFCTILILSLLPSNVSKNDYRYSNYRKINSPKKIKVKSILFGIDISQYQGNINWEELSSQKEYLISFIIIRSTMGANRKDKKFEYNFKKAKEVGFIVGSYHYYDPNENSKKQYQNYIESVTLRKGDFVPILDIEKRSKIQSMKSLKSGITHWLNSVEKYYGVKPIIYTNVTFYKKYFGKDFFEYPIWIGAYSKKEKEEKIVSDADIHQFTESLNIKGIRDNKVDGNYIEEKNIKNLLIK